MKKNSLVKIKGTNDNITIFLDDEEDLESVIKELYETLYQAFPVISQNRIILNFGKRININKKIENTVNDIKVNMKLPVTKIIFDLEEQIYELKNESVNILTDNSSPKIIKKTIRSGQKIFYEGDIILFGNINPGGEISSNGNITVLGDLRGVVHAGFSGNKTATIIGYKLNPLQIRIANFMIRGEELLKKIKKNKQNDIKIIYLKSDRFTVTNDFSILREELYEE